jgi:hypothetical protein
LILELLDQVNVVPHSIGIKGFNRYDLYAAIQRILAGGEDYYTEEPSPAL